MQSSHPTHSAVPAPPSPSDGAPSTSDGAPSTQRLYLDTRAVRDDARLRVAAGAVALLAACWLLLVSNDWLLRAFGAAGLVFSVLWAVRFGRARETLSQPEESYLELSPQGLILVERGHQRAMAWEDTEGIAIDEDRLQVLVLLSEGSELRIEPQYGHLALRKLAEIIYQYRTEASACIGASDG